MRLVAKNIRNNYEASKFERLFEEKLASSLQEKGIELTRIIKDGYDEDAPEYELEYLVYINPPFGEYLDYMQSEFGLELCYTNDSYSVLSCAFVWSNEDADVLEEDCIKILNKVCAGYSEDLYRDTYKHLEKGIRYGNLETLVAEED